MIEIDLENNPIDSVQSVLHAVQNKKDILLLNLRLAPLIVRVQSYEEFLSLAEECGPQVNSDKGVGEVQDRAMV